MLLAVLIIIEMMLSSLLSVVDIFYIASFGADAVAVVGITEASLSFFYVVILGLATATTAIVARRVGEKNVSAANVIAGQTLFIGLVFALIVSFAGVKFSSDILQYMGAANSTVTYGHTYTEIMFGGSSSIIFLFLLNAILRGAGDVKITLRALLLSNGLNLIIDPLLIFGLDRCQQWELMALPSRQ